MQSWICSYQINFMKSKANWKSGAIGIGPYDDSHVFALMHSQVIYSE